MVSIIITIVVICNYYYLSSHYSCYYFGLLEVAETLHLQCKYQNIQKRSVITTVHRLLS